MKKVKNNQLSLYDHTVRKAYFRILKGAKQLLSHLEREELRYSLVRDESKRTAEGVIIHEFVSPLIYMRLELQPGQEYTIHYGIEQVADHIEHSNITSSFVRNIFKLTSKEVTPIDIESAVKTDWLIDTPSVMFEFLEDLQKYHELQVIKYRVTAGKRKELHHVA